MSLFIKKTNRFLGVDIGSASTKLLELENKNGRPTLINYGFAEKGMFYSKDAEDSSIKAAETISKVYREAGMTAKNTIGALHNFDVFTSIINLPETKSNELENNIRIEARKFVPIPLEDVILDWKVINKKNDTEALGKKKAKDSNRETFFIEQQQKGIDVLLTAAPKKLISNYIQIFQAAHLHLLSLETESFAFIRSLLSKNDMSSLMIIDIGAVASDIIIVEGQIPVVIRTVDVGGKYITASIARNLGISESRAEQFKRDIGISGFVEESMSSVMQVVESIFASVINEIHYSIDLYHSRDKNIEKIILSGGSAFLNGLVDLLKSTFNIPVSIGDPWHKIDYPKELESVLKEIAPMFTVAIGLALKEIAE